MDIDIPELIKDLRRAAQNHPLDLNLDLLDEAADGLESLRQQLAEQTSDHIVDANNMVGGSVEVLLEALRLAKITFISNGWDVRNVMEVIDDALNAYSSKPTVK
jgi:hypothetical protein